MPKNSEASIDMLDEMIAKDLGLQQETVELKYHFPPPILPERSEAQRPHILVVDDERAFLYPLQEHHRLSGYDKAFTLHTLHLTRQSDVLAEISAKIQTCHNIKALFLDRGLDIGLSAIDIIQHLRQKEVTRYLPIAIITKAQVQDLQDMDRSRDLGAQRVIFNKRATATFLYELYTSLEQLEEAIQQKKWLDLWDIINATARRQADKLDSNAETDILTELQKHLIHHMGHSFCVIREITSNGKLKLLSPYDAVKNSLSEEFYPKDVPFIQTVLDSESNIAQHTSCLSAEELGILATSPLMEKSVLACVMRHGTNTLGTVTVYRESDQPPFRKTDITFMTSFATDLGNLLGARRARQRLYERQKNLLQFIANVDATTQEYKVINQLLDLLHKDIQHNNNEKAKTTLRLLDLATGDIKRAGRPRGLQNTYSPELNLETEQSTYTQAIQAGEPLRSGNMQADGIARTHTLPSIKSCLVVPMMAGKLCLGAVNLESENNNAYDDVDQMYAFSLARIAGDALGELYAKKFQTELLDSFRTLLNQNHTEPLLIHEICHDASNYFGFSRLLYMQKISGSKSDWEVTRVMDRNGQPCSDRKIQIWYEYMRDNWKDTNVKRILDTENPQAESISSDNIEIPEDETQNLKIRSIAVVPLYESPATAPDSALVLLFRVKYSVNDSHLKMLRLLGELLNAARYHQAKVAEYLMQAMEKINLAELGESAAQSRHSLVNQLGAITNSIDLFRQGSYAKEQFLTRIAMPIERLTKSVDRKRHWIKSPEPAICDARQIWQTTAAEFDTNAQAKHITLETTGADIPLYTDADILGIIFFNLIQNALEACSEHSRIWLEQIATESEDVILQVCDNGPGIAPAIQHTLFDLGTTTKPTGSGFGLFFTRRRIHDLQGTIRLQPQPVGTCFQITLPTQCNDKEV